MLLTISTTHRPTGDLGYLLHKHPDRFQSFALGFGEAHVFYPHVSEDRAEACLMLEVDAVGLARRRDAAPELSHYVNDRPYVASSLMSVAIAQVFGSALAGRCKDRPDLVDRPIPLIARIQSLPVRTAPASLRRLFEPLGYETAFETQPLDERFPSWGESPYVTLTLRGAVRLSDLLTHLYVLIPVLDNAKHYYVDAAEIDKLLAKGGDWLREHPERDWIVDRYLKRKRHLTDAAKSRLGGDDAETGDAAEESLERPLSLNDQRHAAVVAALTAPGVTSVLDLGCSEGRLLKRLAAEPQFERIVGLDVSPRCLERAARRLRLDPDEPSRRIELIHGSLLYPDERLAGFDAAALVEVIEHLDPSRLETMERVVFERAHPDRVVVTTPNREYNVVWDSLAEGAMRHGDHRFEWDRERFTQWALDVAERFGYGLFSVDGIGPTSEEHPDVGQPTQMAVFVTI